MTPREQAADIRDRDFPVEEMQRIAREGSFEEVVEMNLATGFTVKYLVAAFRRLWDERQLAAEHARI